MILDKVKIGVVCQYDYFYTDFCDAVEKAYDVKYTDNKGTFVITTSNREYIHQDLNNIDSSFDFASLDAILTIFTPGEYIGDEVEETLKKAKENGIDFMFFYANIKPEKINEELIEETKTYITDLISYEVGLSVFTNPLVFGYLADAIFDFEASINSIRELVKEYDDKLYTGIPFEFRSESARPAPTPKNFLVTGVVTQGAICINEKIEIINNKKKYIGKITKIWAGNLFKIKKNQKARIFIEGIDDVKLLGFGTTINRANSISLHKKFNAKIYVLTKDQGAWKHYEVKPNQDYIFSINNTEYNGKTLVGESKSYFGFPLYHLRPGETDLITVELDEAVPVYVNKGIALYSSDDDMVAHGEITEILD